MTVLVAFSAVGARLSEFVSTFLEFFWVSATSVVPGHLTFLGVLLVSTFPLFLLFIVLIFLEVFE